VSDHKHRIRRTGYTPSYHQKIIVGFDIENLKVLYRHTPITVLTGHTFSLDGATGVGGGPYGAAVSEVLMSAVRTGRSPKTVPFDDSGKAAAFGGSRDIDEVTDFEHAGHGHLLTELVVLDIFRAKLSQYVKWSRAAWLAVTLERTICPMWLLLPEAELHRIIPVFLLRLDLHDGTGTSFNKGYRDQ